MKIFQPADVPSNFGRFSRASTATYIDDAGLFQTAAVDVPRYQDGSLLVESAATNLLTYSQDFSNAVWVKSAASIVANAASSPLGAGCFKLTENTSNASHGVAHSNATPTTGLNVVVYVVAKAAERSRIILNGIANNSFNANFDLLLGVVGSVGSGTNAGIRALSDGWFLCWVSKNFTSSGVTGARCSVQLATVDALSNTYVGNGSSGVLLACAQYVSNSLDWSSYILNTNSVNSRSPDVVSSIALDFTGGQANDGSLLWTDLVPMALPYDPALTYYQLSEVSFIGKVYRVLLGQSASVAENPSSNPEKWEFVGIDKRIAPFDGEFSTLSGQSSPTARYSYLVRSTGAFDCLLLSGLSGVTSLSVRVTSVLGGSVVFQRTVAPDSGSQVLRSQYLFSGFSAPEGASFSITLSTSLVAFSHGLLNISWGRLEEIGHTRYGPRAGVLDFSRKEADEFGNVSLVRRAFSKTVSAQVEVEKGDINRVSDRLYELRATPLVWIFSDELDFSVPLVLFGFYRDFYSSIELPTMSVYSFEVEGLA